MTAYELVQQQAEDEGLWFVTRRASEAYLQRELRKLHAAVEAEHHLLPPISHRTMSETQQERIEHIDGLMEALIRAARHGTTGDVMDARSDLGRFMMSRLSSVTMPHPDTRDTAALEEELNVLVDTARIGEPVHVEDTKFVIHAHVAALVQARTEACVAIILEECDGLKAFAAAPSLCAVEEIRARFIPPTPPTDA